MKFMDSFKNWWNKDACIVSPSIQDVETVSPLVKEVDVPHDPGYIHASICYGSKVDDMFLTRMTQMCKRLKWDVDHFNWLMACMAFETGGTFAASCKNKWGSGAIGLLQFMPSTAIDLGTTTFKLGEMSNDAQIKYVGKYFTKYGYHKRIKSLEDMYMAILLPKYISASNDTPIIIRELRETRYVANIGLDLNKDGIITKGEAAKHVRAHLESGMNIYPRKHVILTR